MRRRGATNAAPQPAAGPGVRIVFCHHEGAPERDTSETLPGYYRDRWEYAVCQVDSRRGGYVRELDAAGRIVRQHPAEGQK